jgi:hypothetical protein
MRESPSPHSTVSRFDLDLIVTMRSVLDSAIGQIDVRNRTPATKAKMAQRIIRAASEGIVDPTQLTALAVEDGKQRAD